MVVEPINDVVAVIPDNPEKITPGGVHLPDNMRGRRYERGTVVAVGPDVKSIKGGDTIYLPTDLGVRVEKLIDNKDVLFYREDDIPAKEG